MRKKRQLFFNKQKLFDKFFHNISRRSISNAVIETGMFNYYLPRGSVILIRREKPL